MSEITSKIYQNPTLTTTLKQISNHIEKCYTIENALDVNIVQAAYPWLKTSLIGMIFEC